MATEREQKNPAVVHVLAPAKVNPWLEVLHRRPDGFHELDTTMVALDLADELRLERSEEPGVQLSLSGPMASPDIPRDSSNLAVRAAEMVLDEAIRSRQSDGARGIRIELEKKIPSQAGLGGGSSDAAAACLGALQLLGEPWQAQQVRELLAGLGSDCVFFHDAATTGFARCKGRGELVETLDPIEASWSFALLAPALAVPTGEVFRALARALSAGVDGPSVPERLFSCTEAEARLGLFNRLEAAAQIAVPALSAWRDFLDQNDAQHFQLSGSGSTYFGMYRNQEDARASLDGLVHAAAESKLALRGTWVARPLGTGACLRADL